MCLLFLPMLSVFINLHGLLPTFGKNADQHLQSSLPNTLILFSKMRKYATSEKDNTHVYLNTDFSTRTTPIRRRKRRRRRRKIFRRVFFFSPFFGSILSGTTLFTLCNFRHEKSRSHIGLGGRDHEWNSYKHSVTTQFVVMEEKQPSPGLVFGCYVFSTEGISWMVTPVESLVVLNCSLWFSELVSSIRGSWKLFSKAGLEVGMLPDTEVIPMVLSGTVLCVLVWRGFEPLLGPRTLETWVRLAEITHKTHHLSYLSATYAERLELMQLMSKGPSVERLSTPSAGKQHCILDQRHLRLHLQIFLILSFYLYFFNPVNMIDDKWKWANFCKEKTKELRCSIWRGPHINLWLNILILSTGKYTRMVRVMYTVKGI